MRTYLVKNILCCWIVAILVTLSSCQKGIDSESGPAADHTLTIHFKPVVDADSLEFGKSYQNSAGEQYTIRNFKFYVCQVDLINTNLGTSYRLNKDEYFLVNFANPVSTEITLKTIPATFNKIAFTIGVDSIRNVSGAQTGALDPANGMFWTWNSGYIMAKLEGNSPGSNQPNQVFEYHIGGFSGSENVVEKVNLLFPLNTMIEFQTGRSTHMNITANANEWFGGGGQISIATSPVCTTPGTLAKTIASNYLGMFEVVNIVTE
jgi:MbnP